MLKMNIKLARDAGIVKRFHLARLIQEETVAQHSFNVANLVLILTEGQASRALILAALTHDMGEYMVGDIPSQVKKHMPPETRHVIEIEERMAVDKIHPKLNTNLNEDEEHLLHLCDNLDGLLKCIDELKMGNQHIIPIGERYAGYIQDLVEHDPLYRLEAECVIADFRSRYLK